jgi:hypothetical protein
MSSFAERFAGQSADMIETRAAAGGMVPPGFYRAKLNGAKTVTSKEKMTPGFELTFQIVGGPFNDMEVTETLWDTDHARSQDRLALFGLRLGVLKRGGKEGKEIVAVDGKKDFLDVLDTPCIIEIYHDEFKKADGSIFASSKLTYGGCHYIDDKDAAAKVGKPVEAKKAGTSAAGTSDGKSGGAGGGSTAAAKKKAVDTSDL